MGQAATIHALRGDLDCPSTAPSWFAVPANHVLGDTITFELTEP
jgi:hypothetical protein